MEDTEFYVVCFLCAMFGYIMGWASAEVVIYLQHSYRKWEREHYR